MSKGVIKKGAGTLVGNAGEYFVVANLLRMGMIAALAPRNTPYFDVLATDGQKSVNIRVKTKSAPSKVWQWAAKPDGTIYRNIKKGEDFVCLVDLNNFGEHPDYYIVPTTELNDYLLCAFKEWVTAPGKRGKPHDATNRHRSFGANHADKEILKTAKNRWDLLGLKSIYELNLAELPEAIEKLEEMTPE